MKQTSYDVAVAGGGLAGVAAATAAAKAGAQVVLVERQPFAGGVSTASLEPCLCNFLHNTRHELVVRGRPLELIERLVALGAAHRHWDQHRGHIVFDGELGKLAMDEMLAEAGVTILYDTLVTDVVKQGRRVVGLQIANRSGCQTLRAGCVVDATGDADVAAYAGAPLHVGPEHMVPHSCVFRMGNVDLDALAQYVRDDPSEYVSETDIALTLAEALDFYEDTGILQFMHWGATKMRAVQGPIARGEYSRQWRDFKWMDTFQMHGSRATRTMTINTGAFELVEPDGERLSYFLREGRKLAHHTAGFLKQHMPGFADSFVVATANAPGLRRTRRLQTDFVLTQELYQEGPHFADAVGRGVVIEQERLYRTDRAFDVPLRCLLPQEVEGLIIGSGRSAACEPCELLRVMPVTMIVGQGAGVTAAVAASQGVTPAQVDVGAVQSALGRQGVSLG